MLALLALTGRGHQFDEPRLHLRMKDNSSWRLAGVLVMVAAPLLAAGGVVVGTQTEDYGIRTGVVLGGSLLLVASGLVGLSAYRS